MIKTTSAFAGSFQPLNTSNAIFCHSCSIQEKQHEAYQKASAIGFYDPISELERPTTVYIFDFDRKSITSYNVWDKFDLMTFKPYTAIESPSNVKAEIRQAWHKYTNDMLASIDTANYMDDISGYDYLIDQNIRNQVHSQIRSSWMAAWLALGQVTNVLDGLVGVLPDGGLFETVTVYFKDNVQVTIKLKEVGTTSLTELVTLAMEYVPDSAYLNDESGRIKIPDDYKESTESFQTTISGSNQAAYEAHLGIYGFTFSGGSSGGGGSSATLTCTVIKKEVGENENGEPKYSFTYRCVRG